MRPLILAAGSAAQTVSGQALLHLRPGGIDSAAGAVLAIGLLFGWLFTRVCCRGMKLAGCPPALLDLEEGGAYERLNGDEYETVGCLCWAKRRRRRNIFAKLHFATWKASFLQMRKISRAISRVTNRPKHACMDTWKAMVDDINRAKGKLRKALQSMLLVTTRKGFNTWHMRHVEDKEKKRRMEQACARISPEGRAKAGVLRTLRELAVHQAKFRRGLKAFTHRGQIAAYNTWREKWERQRANEEAVRRALARMSPEGRAKLQVVRKLLDIAESARKMRQAVQALRLAPFKRAWNAWCHLSTLKIQGHQSKIRLAVQRGEKVDVMTSLFESLSRAQVDELVLPFDEIGMTPLLWASRKGFARAVDGLLRFTSDVAALLSAKDPDGSTALHHACRQCHTEVVKLLLDAGADANAVNDADKSTPLMYAARKNAIAEAEMLLAAGADKSLANRWGTTALDNAKFKEFFGVVAVLSDDPEERRIAKLQAILQKKLRPTEEEQAVVEAQMTADAKAERERRQAKSAAMAAALEAQRVMTKQVLQQENRMAACDRALVKGMEPVGARKLERSNPNEPWLDFNKQEHDELRRIIHEAREAGSAEHYVFGARLKDAQLVLDQLDAHAAGREVPRGPPGSPGSPIGAAVGPPVPHTSLRETETERAKRKVRLTAVRSAGKMLSQSARKPAKARV